MVQLGFKIVFGVFLAMCCVGVVVGAISALTSEIKIRLQERRLANRWQENADPFIGAP
jgi:hypothetical protein